MKLPLPFDTQSVLKDNNMLLKTSNLGLLFNKYVSVWSDGWTTEEKRNKEKVNLKAKFLGKIKQESFYLTQTKTYVESLYRRQQAMINDLKDSGWHIESFNATTDSRLIIGLGGTSVIETGMTLHPLYGFPYLPGSGLKGLARAYAEIAVEHKPTEEEFRTKELKEIFGSDYKEPRLASENTQGGVFFMDGLPTAFPQLDLDIMNPHYSEYYQGDNPPADYMNPVPVTFLTVAPGQPFLFTVFSRDKSLSEKAKQWLMGGLTELGAGGKTNVGYGYFKLKESLSVQVESDTKVKRAERSGSGTTTPEKIIWQGATVTWNPGSQTLIAMKDNKKAELKISNDRGMISEVFHKKLFDKRQTVSVKVTVESLGNYFRIIRIEPMQ